MTLLFSTLLAMLRTLAYGWVVALVGLLKLLHRTKACPEDRDQQGSRTDCVPIDHPAFVRPDPLLYSQRSLLNQGLAVTWDNPDIILFKAGVPVSSGGLDPATTYDVQARVWNNSLEAPVIDMPVHLSMLDFGVGTVPIKVGSGTVDVGVKGSATQPGFVSIPWTTPATPGHFCLQVLLDPADDSDRSNNLGQENTSVAAAQSPAQFTFTLHNDSRRVRTYRFEVDAYQIPPAEPCGPRRSDTRRLLDRNVRGLHPVPDGFAVQIQPPATRLDAGEAVTVAVSVEPPAGFRGRQPLNINVFHEQGLAGGVTLVTVKEA